MDLNFSNFLVNSMVGSKAGHWGPDPDRDLSPKIWPFLNKGHKCCRHPCCLVFWFMIKVPEKN
jgi:hypothetical protein